MGWIKLHRKLTEWGWYGDTVTTRVFLHLLLTANYEPSDYHGTKIEVGQAVYGRKELATKLTTSENQIRTALDHLQHTGEITIKTTNKFSVATIVKWRDYQVIDEENHQQNCQPTTDEPPTNHQQTTSKITTSKKKEDKKEDVRRTNSASLSDFFESVWALYPNKKGKGAVSPTQKERLYKIGIEELTRCIDRYRASKEDWRPWKDGSTFFNSGYVDYLDANYQATNEQPSAAEGYRKI